LPLKIVLKNATEIQIGRHRSPVHAQCCRCIHEKIVPALPIPNEVA
jgi:hypothetical protein